MDPKSVLRRFQAAGKVIELPKKPSTTPKVPLLAIRGTKYRLSDYWPMMSDLEELGGGPDGAKVIDTGGSRFRYLWAYDTEKGYLAMYRVSDGDEKFHERANSFANYIYALEKKGQLNRVTHEDFVLIERYMRDRQEETIKNLKHYLDEQATDYDRQVKSILEKWFNDHVIPVIERKLDQVKQGVIPLGFKVNDRILQHKTKEEQAKSFVIGEALKVFTMEKAYEVVSEALGLDAHEPGEGRDNQAPQWSWSDIVGEAYDRFL